MDENEQLETLKRWWNSYGTPVLAGVVVVLGSFFGWQFYQDYQQRQAEQASVLFSEYLELRETDIVADGGGTTPAVEQVLAQLDSDYRGTGYHTFTLLYRAGDAGRIGDYERSEAYLREAIDSSRDQHLRDVARLRLARVQHATGRADDALSTLQDVRGSGFHAVAAELTGDIRLERDDREGAREAYQRAVELRPAESTHPVLEMKLADVAAES